ncbi:MAG: hypothetical protein KF833_05160 [Verrucomicrobiae bacterium]|nr:hypothetical protein [Verrucomicrobiae bacterium]
MPGSIKAFAQALLPHLQSVPASLDFEAMALGLFRLQFDRNPAYRRLCLADGVQPDHVPSWDAIPAVPTVAFKEMAMTSLPEADRTHWFLSSGTTRQESSRHYHHADSLSLYEAAATAWFTPHLMGGLAAPLPSRQRFHFLSLTPSPDQAPHSSLVHMIARVAPEHRAGPTRFLGTLASDGSWELDPSRCHDALREYDASANPVLVLGTAFHFVHWLEAGPPRGVPPSLPPGSRVMETGGYKGRSRVLDKAALHQAISELTGIPPSHIVSEYGMSELSSQAYDHAVPEPGQPDPGPPPNQRSLRFPPWVRIRVISPEHGREVAPGEIGRLRIWDLANVWSVMAIQTDDLAVRTADGFRLAGRAPAAPPRGCSLMVQPAPVPPPRGNR